MDSSYDDEDIEEVVVEVEAVEADSPPPAPPPRPPASQAPPVRSDPADESPGDSGRHFVPPPRSSVTRIRAGGRASPSRKGGKGKGKGGLLGSLTALFSRKPKPPKKLAARKARDLDDEIPEEDLDDGAEYEEKPKKRSFFSFGGKAKKTDKKGGKGKPSKADPDEELPDDEIPEEDFDDDEDYGKKPKKRSFFSFGRKAKKPGKKAGPAGKGKRRPDPEPPEDDFQDEGFDAEEEFEAKPKRSLFSFLSRSKKTGKGGKKGKGRRAADDDFDDDFLSDSGKKKTAPAARRPLSLDDFPDDPYEKLPEDEESHYDDESGFDEAPEDDMSDSGYDEEDDFGDDPDHDDFDDEDFDDTPRRGGKKSRLASLFSFGRSSKSKSKSKSRRKGECGGKRGRKKGRSGALKYLLFAAILGGGGYYAYTTYFASPAIPAQQPAAVQQAFAEPASGGGVPLPPGFRRLGTADYYDFLPLSEDIAELDGADLMVAAEPTESNEEFYLTAASGGAIGEEGIDLDEFKAVKERFSAERREPPPDQGESRIPPFDDMEKAVSFGRVLRKDGEAVEQYGCLLYYDETPVLISVLRPGGGDGREWEQGIELLREWRDDLLAEFE